MEPITNQQDQKIINQELNEQQKVSKRQIKRQKKFEEYINKKKEKRKLQKQLKKEQIQEKQIVQNLQGLTQQINPTVGDEEQKNANENVNNIEKQHSKLNRKQYRNLVVEKMKQNMIVVIDFQFIDSLNETEINSLVKQIGYCFSSVKNVERPVQMTLTSYKGNIKEQLQKLGCQHWGIQLKEENIMDLYPKENIIYLSSDAKYEMDILEEDKIYIIGGLVDHNRLKNLTNGYATKFNLQTRKLPLRKYISLRSCENLNVNHVFDILLNLYNGLSWEQTLQKCIPKRKFIKDDDSDNDNQQQQLQQKEEGQQLDNSNNINQNNAIEFLKDKIDEQEK